MVSASVHSSPHCGRVVVSLLQPLFPLGHGSKQNGQRYLETPASLVNCKADKRRSDGVHQPWQS